MGNGGYSILIGLVDSFFVLFFLKKSFDLYMYHLGIQCRTRHIDLKGGAMAQTLAT